MDKKYDIKKHPNVIYTPDGKGERYIHGVKDYSIASIKLSIDNNDLKEINIKDEQFDYEIVFSEDIDYYWRRKENEKNERKIKES